MPDRACAGGSPNHSGILLQIRAQSSMWVQQRGKCALIATGNSQTGNKDPMMAETSKKPEDNSEPNPSDTRDRGRLHAVADQAVGAARQVGEKGAEVVKRAAETAAD